MGRALTVQTVRYGNDRAALVRSVTSVGYAIERARAGGLNGDVTVAHGDASATPLDELAQAELRALGTKFDFTYEYRYFDENTGSAKGQNRLAALFPAEWQFVTNPDVIIGGTALRRLWARTTDPTVGILEARQLPLQSRRAYDAETGETSWADGSCSLVRGELWRALGGYDETFFLYGDDVDMSWRARLAGYRVLRVAAARVFHDKRLRIGGRWEVPPHEIHYSAVAAFLIAAKWGTPADVERTRVLALGSEFESARAAIADLERWGRVPARVPDAERVAEIAEDGTFGRYRW